MNTGQIRNLIERGMSIYLCLKESNEILYNLYGLQNMGGFFIKCGDVISINVYGKILFCKCPEHGFAIDIIGALSVGDILSEFVLKNHIEAWQNYNLLEKILVDSCLIPPVVICKYPVRIDCHSITL